MISARPANRRSSRRCDQVLGPPIVSEPRRDSSLFEQADKVGRVLGQSFERIRIQRLEGVARVVCWPPVLPTGVSAEFGTPLLRT